MARPPKQVVTDGQGITTVALLGADFPGMRPALKVEVGHRVKGGQALFVDRQRPQIAFTAPGTGTVLAIHRGRRRALDALVIALEDDANSFDPPVSSKPGDGRQLLLEAGLWPAFLTRPFGRIPDPDAVPNAIFVTAIDTNPLGADASVVLTGEMEAFGAGLDLLAGLTKGTVFVCQAPGRPLADERKERIECVTFEGPHPAGLPGTHIHYVAPASRGRVVWHIGYQDVVAIGRLVATGRLCVERVISLAGPRVREPRLVRSRLGASLHELTAGELDGDAFRVVSGSPLCGREAGFLGRYHSQVCVLSAARKPVQSRLAALLLGRPSHVPLPLIPLAAFDRIMALDMLAVPLLRALSVGDAETAERLGCLELIEEDLALFSYVCASKADYGAMLRSVLDDLEAGG